MMLAPRRPWSACTSSTTSWPGRAFHVLWLANVITYVFITSFALLIDPQTGQHTWKEALLFPGAVNVVILLAGDAARADEPAGAPGLAVRGWRDGDRAWVHGVELFTYVWLAACMGVAFLGQGGRIAAARLASLGPLFVYIGGYGPLLCADHRRRLRQGAPARRGALGQDGEDRQDGGPDMTSAPATRRASGDRPATAGAARASERVGFREEVGRRGPLRARPGGQVPSARAGHRRPRHPVRLFFLSDGPTCPPPGAPPGQGPEVHAAGRFMPPAPGTTGLALGGAQP